MSMAWGAVRKLRSVIDNVRRILSIEAVVAARAIDLRKPLDPAAGTGAARTAIRHVVAGPGPDRILAPELAVVEDLIGRGDLLSSVETVTGPLS